MADDNQTISTKSDSSAGTATATQPDLSIPVEVQKKFAKLIGLIKDSQSMDNEERQYWIDVLPIMTQDQISNLKGILANEKKQIEKTDKEYEEGIKKEIKKSELAFDEFKYKEKKRIREESEKLHESEELKHEKALLEEISKM